MTGEQQFSEPLNVMLAGLTLVLRKSREYLKQRKLLMHCQSLESGLGGRRWTERIEGSPGVSSWRSPTPATLKRN